MTYHFLFPSFRISPQNYLASSMDLFSANKR